MTDTYRDGSEKKRRRMPILPEINDDGRLDAAAKVIFVIVLAAFMLMIYNRTDAKDVPMSKIEANFIKHTDIEKMAKCDDRQMIQFMKLGTDQFDSYLYYKSKEALGVEEILVVKVKSKEDIPTISSAAEERVKSQINVYESYGPRQVKLLKGAVIKTKGRYLFYCTSADADKYEEVFKDSI